MPAGEIGREWRHAAGGEVDEQEQDLLHRHARPVPGVQHLVREVEALGVGAEQDRADAHAIAEDQLAPVERVRLHREDAGIHAAAGTPSSRPTRSQKASVAWSNTTT